ncbi:secretory carrier-associated membrane protein 1 isoform X2 [Hyalella azteca]|uniref:Secretory carrier-associated membrane protein n=1 Tax=Hyalella azteca TaxID=294128 RepID=A0A8B7NZI8_HYAAZ|nr:secretory carrier-associated membrane protein 1 isoform X2 [Hyalella azteca]
MSGFDDNPFADPFADPSIQQAVNPPPSAGLDNYDPFSDTSTRTQSYNQPATLPATNTTAVVPPQQPPPYTPSAQQQQQSTAAEFQRRQEELEKKAQELARREEELRNATHLNGPRANNWPPLPSHFPVSACFYQDINIEIPLEFQRIVRLLYHLWMFHALMLLLNMLGGLAILFSNGEAVTFGLGLLYLLLFTPVSYVCWFRTVYKAFRDDSSFNFMVFFFIFFFQTVVAVVTAVGIPSMGSCGWVSVGRAFGSHQIALGIFLTLVALGCSADAGGMAVLLLWVHRIYRSTGAINTL